MLSGVEIMEKKLEEEQARWQRAIYEMLVKFTDDRIDGGGCDSADPLDFTLAEIGQAIMYLRDQGTEWISVKKENSPHGIPVWLWSKDWIDEDFNPTGVREGFFVDGEGYVSCGWDPCQDVFTTDEESVPTKWAHKVMPDLYKEGGL